MRAKGRSIPVCVVILLLVAGWSTATSGQVGAEDIPTPRDVDPKISDILSRVTESKVLTHLQYLEGLGTRYSYSPKVNTAASYLAARLNDSGLRVEFQRFFFGGHTISNVIGVKEGVIPSSDYYIVSGHYDSIVLDGNDPMVTAPGADDDGSGTAAMLVLADAMKDVRLNTTVKFVGWVAEEQGLVGSSYYVNNLDRTNESVRAIFQMDMIGNIATPSGPLGVDFSTNTPSNWIGDLAMSVKDNYSIDIPLYLDKNSNAGSSDHAPFWDAGYNGTFVAEHAFSPHWHKVTDTISNLNLTNIVRSAQIVGGVVATLAGVVHDGQGVLLFDSPAYPPNGTPTLTLNDTDLVGISNVTLEVRSSIDSENFTLLPVGGRPGEFNITIPLEPAPSGKKGDGRLQVTDSDTITSTYDDVSYNTTRTARAEIDGIPPRITGVDVRDITNESAAVYFETDEPTDLTVEWGETPALGSKVKVLESSRRHYTVLWGLRNDTEYHFRVSASDRIGNTAVSNGSGSYRFRTATLSIKPTMPGYAGWVVSSENSGNHFDDDDMYTGLYQRDVYMGAVQFDTSAIAGAEDIVGVSLGMATQTSSYMSGSSGIWAFQMLGAGVDTDFPFHSFSDISGALVESNVGTFRARDIAPAWFNTAVFTPTDIARFMSHLPNGAISFRTSMVASGGLADWDTGYIASPTQRGLGPKWAPRLNIFMNSSYATVEGSVRSNGSGLPGAVVHVLENASGAGVADITTLTLGRYYLRLPAGTYDLYSAKPGYVNSSMRTLTLNAGDHLTGIDFDLEKEVTTGMLTVHTTSAGSPLSSVNVSVYDSTGALASSGTTDASGSFNTTLEKGRYDVNAHRAGYYSSNASVDISPKAHADLTLELLPALGWIRGRVSGSATGAAIAGADVRALLSGQVIASDTTNASGGYDLSVPVPPGRYLINVSAPDHIPTESYVDVNTTWDVVLERSVQETLPGVLHGRVVDTRGTPLPGAEVDISNDSGDVMNVTSDLSGEFNVTLPPGRYTLTVTLEGYLTSTTEVTVTSGQVSEVVVTLERTAPPPEDVADPIVVVALVVPLLIIAVVMLVLWRRRRPPPQKEEDEATGKNAGKGD